MSSIACSRELPPRARRIPEIVALVCGMIGTTSACAENTAAQLLRAYRIRNYLRVRGEYMRPGLMRRGFPELPPRARRILPQRGSRPWVYGTTSACAENTRRIFPPCPTRRNYLRVRGEYFSSAFASLLSSELPPRARRIPPGTPGRGVFRGTTSACAENTVF